MRNASVLECGAFRGFLNNELELFVTASFLFNEDPLLVLLLIPDVVSDGLLLLLLLLLLLWLVSQFELEEGCGVDALLTFEDEVRLVLARSPPFS